MIILLRGVILAAALISICSCATVITSTNELPHKIESKLKTEYFNPLDTSLGKVYAQNIKENPELSGAMLISTGSHALAQRIALARMAENTIELQTYIYENDTTSRFLLHEMKLAADRGVKVRILVDDNGLDSDDSDIMTLDKHPNIEVKVFNPMKYRTPLLRYPQLVFDMNRLHFRMHNKLFIVDSTAVIIGGRNIANNYFDNHENINFSDVDIMFIGKIAADAVISFNEYWNYHRSVPASVFPLGNDDLEEKDKEISNLINSDNKYNVTIDYFIKAYKDKKFPIYWGKGTLIADSPYKIEKGGPRSSITNALEYIWAMTESSIYISAAYFIPGETGTQKIINSINQGISIKILTNSLSSTDSMPVYAGWIKYRDELLKNGAEIYEYRNEGYKPNKGRSSRASLHSKVMVFDNDTTWIGSFNMDGRSAELNTEVIALFHNNDFANLVIKSIENDMTPNRAWKLVYEKGRIGWYSISDGKPVKFNSSPDAPIWKRSLMYFLGVIPETLL